MNTLQRIKIIRSNIDKAKVLQESIIDDIRNRKKELRQIKNSIDKHEKAKEIVIKVGLETQQQLEVKVSDITSMAMETVFPEPYKIELEFVQRRNKTECDIYFVRNGNRSEPLSSSAGGTLDIASFALRIACWTLQIPRKNNTIILDEPTKWVSKTYRQDTAKMLKEISEKLNLQFIIVTHDPVLTQFADKVFEVSIKNGISQIK